jgi:ATP-dependent DNA helicase PIF1
MDIQGIEEIIKKVADDGITFTSDQLYAIICLLSGKNVFLTGAGGVGKSKLIEIYYKIAVDKYSVEYVSKTSTTGISALNIGGRTIHSWSGIKLGDKDIPVIIKSMNPIAKESWKTVKVLFIDEISMLHPDIFDKLNAIGKILRKSDLPFGGMQLVLSGDFLQLPVVASDKQCFEAASWKSAVTITCDLKEIVRQRDISFQTVLNEVRFGILSDESLEILRSRVGVKLNNESGILPTKLYPKNKDVEIINN